MDRIIGHLAVAGARLPDRLCRGATGPSATLHVTASQVLRDGATTIALRGRPRIGAEPFDPVTTAQRLAALHREHGAAFLKLLRGPFAIAVVDGESRDALLAIDRMGVETLAWALSAELLSFGTSSAAVAGGAFESPALNRQALFDFMLGHVVGAPDTAYAHVSKLLAGTYLALHAGRVTLHRYWEPDFAREPHASIAALREQVLPTIAGAIERCEPGERTGTFLSGGLDSSTVTGLFAKRSGGANAFSVGFGVDEFNELSYARIAAGRFGCKHNIYEVTPGDIVELTPKIAAAYDEPFGNSSAVPTLCCARFAQSRGMDHLLAGDGGDEIFGGNSRYVRHKIFELYGRLPRFLRTGIAEPLARRLDPESGPWPLRKLSSYVRQARVPLPERFESWNMIYREGPEAVFEPDFLAAVDTGYPLRRMRELWESCPSSDLLDKMLWYDWKLTLADNDLRKVSRMCEIAGIRVSYPMLDEDVVDLSIRVPSAEKIAGAQLRTFFKDSVRGFLPDEIIKKQKHGFGLPFGVWLKTDKPLQDLVYGTLESLRARGIVSAAFVDRVANEHRSGHASYYGYAIWDMVMLELWLGRQPAATR
jgi:asparagine synthase (glutamine-hydrolysing)